MANDARSVFRVRGISQANGTLLITWSSVPNKTYTIQYLDALGSNGWRKLADIFARTNNRVENLPDPSWTTNRFYRVVTPQNNGSK